MKVSNENKVLIGVGALAVGGLGFLYWRKKKQEAEQLAEYTPEPTEPTPTNTGNPKPIQGATLNKSKVLRKGSKGIEVRELQRLLGIDIDGDFGNQTLTALQMKKGVSEISINAYLSKTTAPKEAPTVFAPLKKGTKLMASKNGVSIFNVKKNADGTYINIGTKPFFNSSFDYGEHIGTYVSVKADGEYLISRDGVYYFVNRNFVKAY